MNISQQDNSTTVEGLVFAYLGAVPDKTETIKFQEFLFSISDNIREGRIKSSPVPPESPDDEPFVRLVTRIYFEARNTPRLAQQTIGRAIKAANDIETAFLSSPIGRLYEAMTTGTPEDQHVAVEFTELLLAFFQAPEDQKPALDVKLRQLVFNRTGVDLSIR